MRTVPEIRQALAEAADAADAASDTIDETKAALRAAEDDDAKAQAQAQAAVDAATKAYADAIAVADDLTDELDRAVEAEKRSARTATRRDVPEGTMAPAQPRSNDEITRTAPVKTLLARMITAHTGGAISAESWLGTAYGDEAAQAITASSHQLSNYATGGALSIPDFAEMIIEGLEAMTVVRQMQPQVLSVPGALIIPKETSAPTGSWLDENAAPSPGAFGFGDIKLDPKRLAVEAVVSRRLLDNAARGGSAVRNLEGYIVRRLREKLAINEDVGFLRGAGTEHIPLGIRHQATADNVFAVGGGTAAHIEADLRALPLRLETANIMIAAGFYVMPPRTRAYLSTLRDSSGNKIYPTIDERNELHGHRVLTTNQVPTNLGGGTDTEIYFVNGPSVIIGNTSDAEVRLSIEGSYQSGDKHISLVQSNQMLIHLELHADCKLERAEAAAVLTGVTY